jgi:hypothetical protein
MASPDQPASPFGSDEDAPVFVIRNGQAWACWLDGRAPLKLGDPAQVMEAMSTFIRQARSASPSDAAEPPAQPAPPIPENKPTAEEPARTMPEVQRDEQRHEISIIGKLRSGTGSRDVTVLDLSESGCRFYDRFGHIEEGAPVTIKLGPVGPIDAVVRWRRGEYVGLQFRPALYPSVLDHIRQHFDLRR